jgi:hypothetical protein
MNGQLALITPIDFSGTGNRPDNSLPGVPAPPIVLPPLPPGIKPPDISWKPGSGHPSNPIFIPLPSRPGIDNSLPGSGGSIDNTLPGSGSGSGSSGSIDNTLPGGPPGHIDNTPILPGTIWPPLNPGDGVQGPGLLLVLVLGCDGGAKWKWVFINAPRIDAGLPPSAQPK